jgi:hypothetical protein
MYSKVKCMEISDIKDEEYFLGKKSKANTKMVAYLDELLKNKPFIKKLKLLLKEGKRESNFKEIPRVYAIPEKYERLKRDAQSATNNRYNKLVESIINEYGISVEAIYLASAMMSGQYDFVKTQIHDVHLCSINDDYLNHLYPLNPADDFAFYNLRLKRRILAYPISIGISPRATKDDIIDFINKNWWWIKEGIDEHGMKPLRIRKRKHNKGLINLIWGNRGLNLKKIKEKINLTYPNNGLIYSEIQDLITYEKKKRLEKLT